jgi:hypothetical protein
VAAISEELGFDAQLRNHIFLVSMISVPARGCNQSPIQWLLKAVSSGVNRQGFQANYSPPFGVEKKNGKVKSPLPISLYGVVFN